MRLTGNVLQKEEYIITCIGFVFMSIVVILLLAIAFYTACFDSAIVASVILYFYLVAIRHYLFLMNSYLFLFDVIFLL